MIGSTSSKCVTAYAIPVPDNANAYSSTRYISTGHCCTARRSIGACTMSVPDTLCPYRTLRRGRVGGYETWLFVYGGER
eukprot:1895040-Rhodomonas_salina.1